MPMRRLEPRDPPPFLIDQNGSRCVADRLTQRAHQRTHLIGRLHIPAEKDKPPRPDIAEKIPFLGGQRKPTTAINRARPHYLPRKQLPPSAFSRSHNAEATSLLGKPAILSRNQVPFSPR